MNKLLAFAFAVLAAPAVASPPPKPKLIVAISIDQFSSNLFERNRARYRYGLKRLVEQGVVFPSGYQSHAATETCPGHSTLLTGRHPAATGIIGNEWLDRASGKTMYCVFDPSQPVPGRPGEGRGPANLRVSTLGEWMRAADPASRTVGVAGKDRSAIMMTGHNPTGVFWWDEKHGLFNTSVPAGTAEAARLAPVAPVNAAISSRFRSAPPIWEVADRSCAVEPVTRRYGDLEVTHQVPPGGFARPRPGSDYLNDVEFEHWLRASPVFDELVVEAANRLIDHYKLGRGSAPDLLAVSLSATDYVGHRYGNDGPEMCDQMAHLDRLLGAFLDRLDRLGVPVAVVLSADHGSIDAAERVAERGIPAQRFSLAAVVAEVGRQVQAELGLGFEPLVGGDQVNIVGTDDAALRRRIAEAARARLAARPEIAKVMTLEEALAVTPKPKGRPDELSLAERVAESTDAERTGDLIVLAAPYASAFIPKAFGDTISSHGSPWNYDRRVPILFWWNGAEPFEQPLAIETVDIAPTLASLIGLATPEVDGVCRDLDRGAGDSCTAAGHR